MKSKKRFFGRVFWVDPSTSQEYQYENIGDSMGRLGCFRTSGIIELGDKDCVIVIHDEEIQQGKHDSVRSNTDIPKALIIKVEEHLGKDKWRVVPI